MSVILNIIKDYFHTHTIQFIIADIITFLIAIVIILLIISLPSDLMIGTSGTHNDKKSSNYTRLFYQSMFDFDNSWYELLFMFGSIVSVFLGAGLVELIDPNHRTIGKH